MPFKIAFRLANLTVYVTAVVLEDSEAEEAHRQVEAGVRELESAQEEEVVTRGFATRVAAILQTF